MYSDKWLLNYMSITYGFISELTKRIELNKKKDSPEGVLQDFWLLKPLPIKIDQYIEHFLYQLNSSESLLVVAYLILEHLLPELNIHNLHRILFTDLVVSYKFLYDEPIPNNELERIGGLKPGKLLTLELAFLDNTELKFNFTKYNETRKFLLQIEQKPVNLCEKEEGEQDMPDDEGLQTLDPLSELSYFIGDTNNNI